MTVAIHDRDQQEQAPAKRTRHEHHCHGVADLPEAPGWTRARAIQVTSFNPVS